MNSTINDQPAGRHTALVIIWSYGLYVLMHLHQYVGVLFAASASGHSFESIISGEFENPQTELAIGIVSVVLGIPLIYVVTRFLWRRSSEWMFLQFNPRYLLVGMLIGLTLPLLIIGVLGMFKIARIVWSPGSFHSHEGAALFVAYACGAIFSGAAEEVVFRGMAVREMAARYGWIIAAIIGGIYFGMAHLVAQLGSMTLVTALWIVLAGVCVSFLFVAMYARSRCLWLPIGFHIAWNFCVKGIMGTTMSGSESRAGLFTIEFSGSPILTGGTFGMEASVVSLVVYVLAAVMLIVLPWTGKRQERISRLQNDDVQQQDC